MYTLFLKDLLFFYFSLDVFFYLNDRERDRLALVYGSAVTLIVLVRRNNDNFNSNNSYYGSRFQGKAEVIHRSHVRF